MSILQLHSSISVCPKCSLHKTRIKPVLPEGNPGSGIMMIAQSPGKVENQTGRMFTGPSGKIFNELLKHAGISRNDFYLTNLIKCMLIKSRDPSREQWYACTPWLIKEIEQIKPKVIVPLGFQATKFVLTYLGIPRPPGKSYRKLFGNFIKTEKYVILPLRHPTALLFNPDKRKVMEENYKKLKELML
ncbi:MAG: uracil-DNA glycosylase [Chlorobi bacterium]|nr:uracil-DNA glycosylase [Chlorobiota bacterium]